MINPDNIKEHMARRGLIPAVDGLTPMETADLVHEESSHIAKRPARRAQADGKNVIWDFTLAKADSAERRIDSLRADGYERSMPSSLIFPLRSVSGEQTADSGMGMICTAQALDTEAALLVKR